MRNLTLLLALVISLLSISKCVNANFGVRGLQNIVSGSNRRNVSNQEGDVRINRLLIIRGGDQYLQLLYLIFHFH